MKNVLFVSDTFLEGGMETRIAEANREYKKHHLNTFLICDSLKDTSYCKNFNEISCDFHFIPTNSQLLVKNILTERDKLISFCKKNKIDFIECQPFWNLFPASLAAQKCKIPISYTLHGIASGNFINPNYCEANILFYLMLSFGLDQIYAVSERVSNIYRYISENIIITRNSISLDNLPKKIFQQHGVFTIASRLDVPKTSAIIKFLPKLYHTKYTKRIDIFGDGDSFDQLKDFITKNHFNDKVHLLGWVDDFKQQLINNQYDCVFGVGRVATDAISTKTPIGLIASDGSITMVSKNNLSHFIENNFLNFDSSEKNNLEKELGDLYNNSKNYLFNKSDLSLLDASNNWQQHILSERNLVFKNKAVIKKIDELFLSNQNEELFLGSSLIDPLIALLNEYGQGKLIYAELIGNIANVLNNRISVVQNQLSALESSLSELESSTSWKITKPLREANRIFHNIKKP